MSLSGPLEFHQNLEIALVSFEITVLGSLIQDIKYVGNTVPIDLIITSLALLYVNVDFLVLETTKRFMVY